MELKDILKELSKQSWVITYNDSRQYIHIQTRFLNHINDRIEFYLIKEQDTQGYYLTDDGCFNNEVEMSGVDFRDISGKLDIIQSRHEGIVYDTQQKEFKQAVGSIDDVLRTVTLYTQFLIEGYTILQIEQQGRYTS